MIDPISFKHPEFLVSVDWLLENLEDPNLKIYDCTAHLIPHPTKTYTIGSGRPDYEKAHIPGADFLDLQEELSDKTSKLRFTFPTAEQFAKAIGSHGLNNENEAILYSTTSPQWATRIWWMLKAFGFDNAKVLDGGLIRWMQKGYPTSALPSTYPAQSFTAKPRVELIVRKSDVLSGIDDNNTCIINALSQDQHTGTGGRTYGRPGRIKDSVNVPTADLINPETNEFYSAAIIAEKFRNVGTESSTRILTYCGGGIAASATAFLLTMLGHSDVGLYDNSLSEWAIDDSLPMEIGE